MWSLKMKKKKGHHYFQSSYYPDFSEFSPNFPVLFKRKSSFFPELFPKLFVVLKYLLNLQNVRFSKISKAGGAPLFAGGPAFRGGAGDYSPHSTPLIRLCSQLFSCHPALWVGVKIHLGVVYRGGRWQRLRRPKGHILSPGRGDSVNKLVNLTSLNFQVFSKKKKRKVFTFFEARISPHFNFQSRNLPDKIVLYCSIFILLSRENAVGVIC